MFVALQAVVRSTLNFYVNVLLYYSELMMAVFVSMIRMCQVLYTCVGVEDCIIMLDLENTNVHINITGMYVTVMSTCRALITISCDNTK